MTNGTEPRYIREWTEYVAARSLEKKPRSTLDELIRDYGEAL